MAGSNSSANTFTIGIVGQVSSGKSSFLNSLCGNIVASSSLQRETFEPTMYIFDNDQLHNYENYDQLDSEREKNKKRRDGLIADDLGSGLQTKVVPDKAGIFTTPKVIRIIDFPGINDAHDEGGKFMGFIEKYAEQCNMLVYVTDASTAFTLQSERQCFEKIRQIVTNLTDAGDLVDLAVIVNKFDDDKDEDLIEITNAAKKVINIDANKIFKYSSHKQLVKQWVAKKLTIRVSSKLRSELIRIIRNSDSGLTVDSENKVVCGTGKQVPGDFDKFVKYIKKASVDFDANAKAHAIATIKKFNPTNFNGQNPIYAKINGEIVRVDSEKFYKNHMSIKKILDKYRVKNAMSVALQNTKLELYHYVLYDIRFDVNKPLTKESAGILLFLIYHGCEKYTPEYTFIYIDLMKLIGDMSEISYGYGKYSEKEKSMQTYWNKEYTKSALDNLISRNPVLKYINKLMHLDPLTLVTLHSLDRIEYDQIETFSNITISNNIKCIINLFITATSRKPQNSIDTIERYFAENCGYSRADIPKTDTKNNIFRWDQVCDLEFFENRIRGIKFD